MGKNTFPDIYHYTDYRSFLRDAFTYKKKENPRFTRRCFAQMAGIKSSSFLKEVIDGKRNLTETMMSRVIGPFRLSEARQAFFYMLVKFCQARTAAAKNACFRQLIVLRNARKIHTLDTAQYEFYSFWYNSAVWALAARADFKDDPAWIARQIDPPITPGQAKKAIRLLTRLGLICKNSHGSFDTAAPRLDVDPDLSTLAIRNFNREMITKGMEAIERCDPRDREVSGVTLGVSREAFEELKEKVRIMKQELADFACAHPGDVEMVCQLNIQLFPFSGKGRKGKGGRI